MKPKRMLTLALGAFVLICGVQSGIAQIGISAPPGRQPNTINLDSLLRGRQVNVDNLEQFRGEWLTLIAMLEELHPGDRVSGFEPRVSVEQLSGLKGTIENLPTEELRLMAMWADRERLSNAVEQLEASLPEEAFGTHDKTIGPEPVRAALPGVTPDATCGSTRSDAALIQGFIIAFEVTEALAILAEVACETIIGEPASGGAKTAACVAMGVAKGLSLAAAVVIDLADFCDSVIDGVEIKGTLDNTVHIHTDLTTHDSNIDGDLAAHDTNIDGDLLLHDMNIDADLIAHDMNIDGDLILHDANLVAHDLKIAMLLAKHDVDIKALLGLIQGGVNTANFKLNVAVKIQREIIRLLLTPAGRRDTTAALLSCDGDTMSCADPLPCVDGDCIFDYPLK